MTARRDMPQTMRTRDGSTVCTARRHRERGAHWTARHFLAVAAASPEAHRGYWIDKAAGALAIKARS